MQLPFSHIHKKATPFFDEKLTCLYGFIGFETLETCFDKLMFLSRKLIPWRKLKFEQINPHPDLIEQINIIKSQYRIRYEIYPYNQKLNKLSAIEFFIVIFFLGIAISLLIANVSYHSDVNVFVSPIIVFKFSIVNVSYHLIATIIAVCRFSICIVMAFIVSIVSAYISFAFQEYLCKNNCYLITATYIYHIFISSDILDILCKKIITPKTRFFSIKGVWHPSSRVPESYKYCNIKAGIVKFYVDDPDYVIEIQNQEIAATEDRNGQHQSLIQQFPNNLGGKHAPFYMYLVESYDEVRDNLRTWSEKLRKK
ncbi:hypothetical protein A2T98_08780 [Nodularia spumigena CENA596]|uniref:Uncharacterized protein n=1 Tax=Nodularia spumigena CENA596 TaxID=1819295 RepID=A0A166JVV2_NODSP|nr:hypothetical protein [Nodularia spumigena]KZL50199.1 hypothetical protein A2T98_08780 [Nodularia spumigena CENA596]